ncbi:MAG: hypothetical protein LBC89_03500 [Bacteroidales bacterium]|nr:hypothetical protein [Bacteroidales bacterium]
MKVIIDYKLRPKGWSSQKTCRHCWYYRLSDCDLIDCLRGDPLNHRYYTIQEYPKSKKTKQNENKS